LMKVRLWYMVMEMKFQALDMKSMKVRF
jgi:hypothetical protein